MVTNAAVVLIKHECESLADELGVDPMSCHTYFMNQIKFLMDEKPGHSLHDVFHGQRPIAFLISAEVAVSMSEYIMTMNKIYCTELWPLLPCLRAQQYEEDSRFYGVMYRQASLKQMMIDFGARQRSIKMTPTLAHDVRQVGSDELMEAIGKSIINKKLSTAAVLSAAMLLDIDCILDEQADKPFEELTKLASAQQVAMFHTHLTSDIRSGPQWGPLDANLVRLFHQSLYQVEVLSKESKTNKMMTNPVSSSTMQLMLARVLICPLGLPRHAKA